MRKIITSVLCGIMLISMTSFGMVSTQKVQDFVYERDFEGISKIISNDWNAMFPHEDFESRDKLIERELSGKGLADQMCVKVLCKEEQVIGFVTFYKESSEVGRVRLVSIAQDFIKTDGVRKLLVAAVSDLFASGCTAAYLVTHKDNEKVSIYESVGFEKDETTERDLAWFEKVGLSVSDYPRYEVTEETFKA